MSYAPIDYAAANRLFPKQKAALTRAVNSKDDRKVYDACKKAVQEWESAPFNGAWPDDWSRWQRALNDTFTYRFTQLDDLR